MAEPLEQDELSTLRAELRRATQHRDAEVERLAERHAEMAAALARVEAALRRARGAPPGGERLP